MCVRSLPRLHLPQSPIGGILYPPVRKSIPQCQLRFSFDTDRLTRHNNRNISKEKCLAIDERAHARKTIKAIPLSHNRTQHKRNVRYYTRSNTHICRFGFSLSLFHCVLCLRPHEALGHTATSSLNLTYPKSTLHTIGPANS